MLHGEQCCCLHAAVYFVLMSAQQCIVSESVHTPQCTFNTSPFTTVHCSCQCAHTQVYGDVSVAVPAGCS